MDGPTGIYSFLSPRQLRSLKSLSDLSNSLVSTLSTGHRVEKMQDDPVAFSLSFRAQSTVSTLSRVKEGLGQFSGIFSVSDAALLSVGEYLQQMKGLASVAPSQNLIQQKLTTTQFIELGNQIRHLINDASYGTDNLLNTTAVSLNVRFGIGHEDQQVFAEHWNLVATVVSPYGLLETMAVFSGPGGSFNINDLGLSGGFSNLSQDFGQAGLKTLIHNIDKMSSRVKYVAAAIGIHVDVIRERADVLDEMKNNLASFSDQLIGANIEEEGARSQAVQVRMGLSGQVISLLRDLHTEMVSQLMQRG